MESGGEAAEHPYRFRSPALAKIPEGQIRAGRGCSWKLARRRSTLPTLRVEVKERVEPGATPEPWAVAAQEASASGAWSVQEYTEAETNSISSRRTSMIFTNTLHVRKLPQMRELCRLSEASHDLDQLAIGVSRCIYRPPCPA